MLKETLKKDIFVLGESGLTAQAPSIISVMRKLHSHTVILKLHTYSLSF